jgi:uncharacterized protein YegL
MIDLLLIVDRSGSMIDAASDHIGGMKSFVRDQKDLEDDSFLTIIQFDSHNPCEVVFDRAPIKDVSLDSIDLIPRGGTPLYSAIGQATEHLQKRQGATPPSSTLCMVITDGQNTDFTEWTKDRLKMRIAELESKNWTFLFLGANVDSFSEAGTIGISHAHSANYSNSIGGSVAAAYGTIGNKVAAVRSAGISGHDSGLLRSAAMCFTPSDLKNIAEGKAVAFDGGKSILTKTSTGASTPKDKDEE